MNHQVGSSWHASESFECFQHGGAFVLLCSKQAGKELRMHAKPWKIPVIELKSLIND